MRSNSPKLVTFIVALLYVSFLFFQLSKNNQDWSTFIVAGDQFVDPITAPENLKIINDSAGYDGQFYYRLALTPFTNKPTDYGITLDNPAYRQQRILYPLIARLFSLGQVDLIPFALVFVNFLAICMIAWIGASYAQQKGEPAFWGCAFALFPGFLLSFTRDTPEIVACCFSLGAIYFFSQRREVFAGILLILAALTKESSLFLSLGIFFGSWLWGKNGANARLITSPLWSILVYIIWRFWLAFNWGKTFFNVTPSGLISYPFSGLASFLSAAHFGEYWSFVFRSEAILIGLFTFFVLWIIRSSSVVGYIKFSWLLYTILVISLSSYVWVEDWAFLRAMSEFYVLGILIILVTRTTFKSWVIASSALFWFLLAFNVVTMR